MSPLKYGSTPVYWDLVSKSTTTALRYRSSTARSNVPGHKPTILRFDSTLEFNVYMKLLDMFPARNIRPQYPVELIPPGHCYKKGRKWKCDFAIFSDSDPYFPVYYVEAKGMLLAEFIFTLATLEATNPDAFDILYLVFGSKDVNNKVINNLRQSEFRSHLYTLTEFNQLTNFS